MDAESIFEEIRGITESFDKARSIASSPSLSSVRANGRTKLTGALANEVIRKRLLQSGIPVSPRDVFINGDPTEFDALVVRPTASPVCGIIYDPHDVAAVLEIKFSGVYSQNVLPNLRKTFGGVNSMYRHIQCIYLTVCEDPKFKYRMTTEVLGSPAFTLNWWVNYKKIAVTPGDDLHEVVTCLQKALSRLP